MHYKHGWHRNCYPEVVVIVCVKQFCVMLQVLVLCRISQLSKLWENSIVSVLAYQGSCLRGPHLMTPNLTVVENGQCVFFLPLSHFTIFPPFFPLEVGAVWNRTHPVNFPDCHALDLEIIYPVKAIVMHKYSCIPCCEKKNDSLSKRGCT